VPILQETPVKDLTEVVTAAKLAETSAREVAAKAREDAGVLRRLLRHVRALLFVALGVLAFILVALR
jgi:hypothetical protein